MSAQGNLLRKKCISGIRIVSATHLIPNYYDLGYYKSVSVTRLIPIHYDLGLLEKCIRMGHYQTVSAAPDTCLLMLVVSKAYQI